MRVYLGKQGATGRSSKVADQNRIASSTALRVFGVLECVAGSRKPMTVASVCEATGLDRATAYRALVTLHDAGYVQRDETGKSYSLGFKIVSMARSLLADDSDTLRVRDVLRSLAEETGETCHYSVLDGRQTVITMREKGTQLVSVDFRVGDRGYLHATSIGKVLLAHQLAEFIDGVLDQPLVALTPNTITNPAVLRRELQTIRAAGRGIDDCEMVDGMRCVAAPIFEAGGSVRSGISTSGPAARYTDDWLNYLGGKLVEYTTRLSAKSRTAELR